MTPTLHVEGEVAFSVTHGPWTTVGTVRGTGHQIDVDIRSPLVAARAAGPRRALRRTVRSAAQQLHDDGLRVVVSGPDGPLLTLGPASGSRSARLLTGSRFATPGPAGLARLTLSRLGGKRLLAGAGGAGILVARQWYRRTR